ncbi:hypothetical protein [Catellatospora sichuanensis]|uniref:hypothetical protein n=1 Tax=Catellatospora sichuanensis TaxID=1969805 RepID=UPI001183E0F3|nr:hypothetical protein [Catellatospora sichuanensis]
MSAEFTYELPADHPDPRAGDVLEVPHDLGGREPVQVMLSHIDVLTTTPPEWWVYGQDRAGYGVRVYVHR